MKVLSDNRKASYDYAIEERYEAGVSLNGGEFKSVKAGNINLRDCFCYITAGEIWLKNCFIASYDKGSFYNEDERRDRRLLMHKREIRKLASKISEKGYTLVVTKVYLNDRAKIKVEVALGKGKKLYDKRQSEKEKELARSLARFV